MFEKFKKVKIKILNSQVSIPEKSTNGSACYDLQAMIEKAIVIAPGEIKKIPTGIAIGIKNKKYAAFIFGRSGLGINHGIMPSNGVGVIDSDYTGEICVGLCNNSKKPYIINPKDRIAQMCIMPIFTGKLAVVQSLEPTGRGIKGFGSTGK